MCRHDNRRALVLGIGIARRGCKNAHYRPCPRLGNDRPALDVWLIIFCVDLSSRKQCGRIASIATFIVTLHPRTWRQWKKLGGRNSKPRQITVVERARASEYTFLIPWRRNFVDVNGRASHGHIPPRHSRSMRIWISDGSCLHTARRDTLVAREAHRHLGCTCAHSHGTSRICI